MFVYRVFLDIGFLFGSHLYSGILNIHYCKHVIIIVNLSIQFMGGAGCVKSKEEGRGRMGGASWWASVEMTVGGG